LKIEDTVLRMMRRAKGMNRLPLGVR